MKAKADLERIKLTWEKDKIVSKSQVEQAKAQVESVKINLSRLTVRAGRRPGFASQRAARPVRRDGLERAARRSRRHQETPRPRQHRRTRRPLLQKGLAQVATLKGRPQVRFDLKYVDVEPYVIPKVSLTGSNADRVNTRVLQVIYSLPDERPLPLYIGQQMDVYLEAAPPPKGIVLEADPHTVKRPFEADDSLKTVPRETLSRPTSTTPKEDAAKN